MRLVKRPARYPPDSKIDHKNILGVRQALSQQVQDAAARHLFWSVEDAALRI
jgi:hypothetical protein